MGKVPVMGLYVTTNDPLGDEERASAIGVRWSDFANRYGMDRQSMAEADFYVVRSYSFYTPFLLMHGNSL
jgi:hypothetical protein